MNIRHSFRYQLRDQAPAIGVFYGVLVGMIILNLIFLPFAGPNANLTITSGGITAPTAFFAFILSLCAFKDSFLMGMQHGVSRRSHFAARIGAMGAVCAILAVADEVYTLLIALLSVFFPKSFFAHSLYEMCYCSDMIQSGRDFTYTVNTTGITVLLSIVFSFFLLLAVCAFGYLITVLNYRLNKTGKIILWCGWPGLFIAGSAFLEANPQLANSLVPALIALARLTLSTLPRLCVTCLMLTAVFSGLTWLLMRRAYVKK